MSEHASTTAALMILALACSIEGSGCRTVPAAASNEEGRALHLTPPPRLPPAPAAGDFGKGVTVRLVRMASGGQVIAFGLPLPPGAVSDEATLRFAAGNAPLQPAVRVLLRGYDGEGKAKDVRAVIVELAMAVLPDGSLDVDVTWRGGGGKPLAAMATYRGGDLSAVSPEVVKTTVRTIQAGPPAKLVDGPIVEKELFVGREPCVLAQFPPGYLAATRILGEQVTTAETARPEWAGLRFLSQAATDFGLSSSYMLDFALNPDAVSDPKTNFEAWLYDRCATFLSFYVHGGDPRFLRHGLRTCSYYADQIELEGARAGIFKGKPGSDPKYSRLRGLYAYYALTGDERALEAGRAMADMWEREPYFVLPYRAGHVRGPTRLWTERLLAFSLEGLIYGHRFTGDLRYLRAFRELLDTAYQHITGDAQRLAAVNPGVQPFPPQNCFIHSALQGAEGRAGDPWCSPWMSALVVDALLRYQEQTGDDRVDEIFIRLVRYLRDAGTQYFHGNPQNDFFLKPTLCFDAKDTAHPRVLAPIYGAGLRADGQRYTSREWADFEHCADVSTLTAAGLRALKRKGLYDANPVPPFASEGESFLQLHHELAFCTKTTFDYQNRSGRDPRRWKSAQLVAGVANPAEFIAKNKIGYPPYPSSPERKLSWWFNGSFLQFGLLRDAGIRVPKLAPGRLQPASCPR